MVVMMAAIPAASAETPTGYILQPLDTLETHKAEFNDVYNVSYDASGDGNAIMLVHFKVPMGHTADFQIYYYGGILAGSASTVWNVSIIPPTTTTSTIALEGVSKQYSYIDTNPEYDYFLSGYAENITSSEQGIIVYNAGYGSFDNDLAIFYPTGNLASNLIYRFDVTCDEPFDVDITYGKTEAVAAAADKNWLEIAYEWMAFAGSLASALYTFVLELFRWLKFFFIDNIGLVIALYLSLSMAYAAGKARDIFDFFRKFIDFQKKFWNFLIELWRVMIEIISTFRAIFRM